MSTVRSVSSYAWDRFDEREVTHECIDCGSSSLVGGRRWCKRSDGCSRFRRRKGVRRSTKGGSRRRGRGPSPWAYVFSRGDETAVACVVMQDDARVVTACVRRGQVFGASQKFLLVLL